LSIDEERDRVDDADEIRVFQSASHTMHGRLCRRQIELTLNVVFIVDLIRALFCSLRIFSLRLRVSAFSVERLALCVMRPAAKR